MDRKRVVKNKPPSPRCRRCLRPLIGEKSIKRGMGRRCWGKEQGTGHVIRSRKAKTDYDERQLELPLDEEIKADE